MFSHDKMFEVTPMIKTRVVHSQKGPYRSGFPAATSRNGFAPNGQPADWMRFTMSTVSTSKYCAGKHFAMKT